MAFAKSNKPHQAVGKMPATLEHLITKKKNHGGTF